MNECTKLEPQLYAALLRNGTNLCRIRVLSSGPSQNPDEALVHFSQNAAPYLREVLFEQDVKHVGVCWGGSVAKPVNAINTLVEKSDLATRNGNPIVIVPLTGKAAYKPHPHHPIAPARQQERINEMSATYTAGALGKAINGNFRHHLSMEQVDAFIGLADPTHVIDERNHSLHQKPGWAAIYLSNGSEPPLINSLDAALVSLGFPGQARIIQEFKPFDQDDFKDRVEFDFAGIFIPKTPAHTDKVEQWNMHSTGVTRQHMEALAKKAADEFKPGVVVIAIGKGINKAPIVHAAIKLGLVNTLVIDELLGRFLLNLVRDASSGNASLPSPQK